MSRPPVDVQQRKKKWCTFTCCQLTPVGCLSIAVYCDQPSDCHLLKAFIYLGQVRQSQLVGEMHDRGHIMPILNIGVENKHTV